MKIKLIAVAVLAAVGSGTGLLITRTPISDTSVVTQQQISAPKSVEDFESLSEQIKPFKANSFGEFMGDQLMKEYYEEKADRIRTGWDEQERRKKEEADKRLLAQWGHLESTKE